MLTEACNKVLKDWLGIDRSSGFGFVFFFNIFFQNHTVCSAGFPGALGLADGEML